LSATFRPRAILQKQQPDVTSDEDLMRQCRQGSTDAFEQLFGRYRQAIWGFFRRRLPDPARGEELAQEVFMAVLQGAARYEPNALFRTYLYRIAFNLLSTERRNSLHRRSEPIDEANAAAPAADPDTAIWVRRAIDQLDPQDREIVLLREYEQLSYEEIAGVMDLPLNTVRSRLFRARIELRRLLIPAAAAGRVR
jgi:RNA polymerase sigma-70 factor (ECF subfamily)